MDRQLAVREVINLCHFLTNEGSPEGLTLAVARNGGSIMDSAAYSAMAAFAKRREALASRVEADDIGAIREVAYLVAADSALRITLATTTVEIDALYEDAMERYARIFPFTKS